MAQAKSLDFFQGGFYLGERLGILPGRPEYKFISAA